MKKTKNIGGFLFNKTLFFKKKFLHSIVLEFDNRLLYKFEEDCLKIEGRDKFKVKWLFFAFLVCAFHKDPIVAFDFNCLYLKKLFDFFQVV